MDNEVISTNTCYVTYKPPEWSDWRCKFMDFTYIPEKGKEPNRFHRFMQEILLGVKWSRIKK